MSIEDYKIDYIPAETDQDDIYMSEDPTLEEIDSQSGLTDFDMHSFRASDLGDAAIKIHDEKGLSEAIRFVVSSIAYHFCTEAENVYFGRGIQNLPEWLMAVYRNTRPFQIRNTAASKLTAVAPRGSDILDRMDELLQESMNEMQRSIPWLHEMYEGATANLFDDIRTAEVILEGDGDLLCDKGSLSPLFNREPLAFPVGKSIVSGTVDTTCNQDLERLKVELVEKLKNCPAGKLSGSRKVAVLKRLARIWRGLSFSKEEWAHTCADKIPQAQSVTLEHPATLRFNVEHMEHEVAGLPDSWWGYRYFWTCDLIMCSAECDRIQFSQDVKKRDKALKVGPLAEDLCSRIVGHDTKTELLKWKSSDEVLIKISKVIPATCKRTTDGRRKRFRAKLQELLSAYGWREARAHTWLRISGESELEN